MTRMQAFDYEVRQASREIIRAKMPEVRMLDAEICWNLENIDMSWDWTSHKLAAGLEKKFIADYEFVICKKSEATALVIIGEKGASGNFIQGKCKNYWVRNINTFK